MQTRLSRRFLTDQRSPVSLRSPCTKQRAGVALCMGSPCRPSVRSTLSSTKSKGPQKKRPFCFGGDEEERSHTLILTYEVEQSMAFGLPHAPYIQLPCGTPVANRRRVSDASVRSAVTKNCSLRKARFVTFTMACRSAMVALRTRDMAARIGRLFIGVAWERSN